MLGFVMLHKAEFQRLVLVLLVVVAWWRGAGPERASAASLLVFAAQDATDRWFQGMTYLAVAPRDVMMDCLVAGLLLAIALRANRMYPLWMAAWQLIAVLSHVARFESRSSVALAYAILMYLPSYLLLGTLGIGLAAHIRRVKRIGEYRSWWKECPPWKLAPPSQCN
jgi:hypothetical protein